jgi:cytochrome c oxidase subunit 2
MVLGAVVIALALAALMVTASRSREGALTHRQGMRLVLWAGGIVPSVVLLALLIATLPAMRPIRAEHHPSGQPGEPRGFRAERCECGLAP